MTHDLAETQSDPLTVEPSRVAVDEKQIEADGEAKWLYAAMAFVSGETLKVACVPQGNLPQVVSRQTISCYSVNKELGTRFFHDYRKLLAEKY